MTLVSSVATDSGRTSLSTASEIMAARGPSTTPAAFAAGVVDGQRAAMISDAVDKLVRPESVATLDAKVVDYAQTHTSVELRGWLKRFIVRVEADLFNERAEAERADRNVDVVHGDDGMAWLNAYLPSHVAAAIMNRLTREAKTLTHDPRTIARRRAPSRPPRSLADHQRNRRSRHRS